MIKQQSEFLPEDSNADYGEMKNIDVSSTDQQEYYKPKPPMHVNPKVMDHDAGSEDVYSNLKNYFLSQQNQQKLDLAAKSSSGVFQKPMNRDIEYGMGMYVIALIAGTSAAVTVGLIAIGIGWYT